MTPQLKLPLDSVDTEEQLELEYPSEEVQEVFPENRQVQE